MGRKMEWTLVAAAIAAVLDWLVGFNFDGLSATQAAAVMVAINAVVGAVAAWRTRPIPPQVYTYLIASLAALGMAYGLHFSNEHVATFTAAVLAVLGLVTRHQVSPVEAVDPRVLGEPSLPA
jgi:uncharacterized membrane protein YoaK (UPF0700 family)